MYRAKYAKKDEGKKLKSKVLIGLVSLSFALTLSSSVAFADADIITLLTNWYNTKTQAAITALTQSVQSETKTQTERLRKEIQLKMEQSTKNIDSYVTEQQQANTKAIREYADKLLENLKASVPQPTGVPYQPASPDTSKEEINNKLINIFIEAEKQMNEAVTEYSQPHPQPEPQLQPQPEPQPQPQPQPEPEPEPQPQPQPEPEPEPQAK